MKYFGSIKNSVGGKKKLLLLKNVKSTDLTSSPKVPYNDQILKPWLQRKMKEKNYIMILLAQRAELALIRCRLMVSKKAKCFERSVTFPLPFPPQSWAISIILRKCPHIYIYKLYNVREGATKFLHQASP